jgi:dipeptidyl aminopeptidase/acylaminoacyl peptidase
VRTIARGLIAAALCAAAAQAWAGWFDEPKKEEERPPTDPLLEPFLPNPHYFSMRLSPDGKHIAALGRSEYGPYTGVVIIDTATQAASVIVKPGHNGGDVFNQPISVTWIRNDRVAVDFNSLYAAIYGTDGKWSAQLQEGIIRTLPDAEGRPSDWVLVNHDYEGRISRYNYVTKESVHVDLDVDGQVETWAYDSKGTIRTVTSTDTAFFSDRTRRLVWYRESERAPWVKIDDRPSTEAGITPMYVPDRPGHLIVRAQGRIWDYDIAARATVKQLAAEDGSVAAEAVDADVARELRGLVSTGLKPRTIWFDPRHRKLQAAIDASLPDTINDLYASDSDTLLVKSYSDVDPGLWYLLDARTMKMQLIAEQMPGIDPRRMQPMRTLEYPSFDGLSIPAYLTLPGKPDKPVPTVVLVHGGPWARDHWKWDAEVQNLAAHGYAVFQPQFRGSTGFGKEFEEAGYGQYGLAMQDDITAGVRHLIAQKIADPDRICIMGASYGGYAALEGLVKTPELFKCGVSVSGVTDLVAWQTSESDASERAVYRESSRRLIGDPKRMKAALDSASPVRHADRIMAPVLIVHGDWDARVPVSHGKNMVDALKAQHKDVQWIEFPNEAHNVFGTDHQRIFYAALYKLLERTIGKGVPPFPPQQAASPAAASSEASPASAPAH